MGRGFYFDKVTKKKHYLDAGASFALDPENRDKNIIWATGKGEKSINRYISESDYIFIISGSPLISKLFNKRVFELLEKRFKNYNDFKKGVLENSKTKDIIELVNSFDSWESFKESPKRKELLLAIDAQKDKNTPLKLFLEKNNAFLDYNALRDGFYADNDFKLNDIMLVLKPTGFGGQSNHSTYSNNVLGDVVGVPDRKINAYDLMTSEFKKENDLKPSAQSQVVAPFGIGVKNIVAPQFSQGKRGEIGKPINWEQSKEGRGDPSISSRNPIVQEAAKNLKEGKITNEEYRATASENSPIRAITRFFNPATLQEIKNAFAASTKKDTEAENIDKPVKEGTRVGLRLDIPSYNFNNTWVVSIHEGFTKAGKILSYSNVAKIKNVSFEPVPEAALNIATGDKTKSSVARMYGEWQNIQGGTMKERGENAKKMVQDIVNDPSYVQVGMNPFRQSYFYDRSSDIGRPIKSADEVIQIGGLVYAKNPVYGNWTDEAYRVKGLLDANQNPVQFSKGNRGDVAANENLINGFYSPLEKTINDSKQDKMPAKQWIDKFAKGEEAKWTGLADWLSSQTGSVSKADIQNYLDDNRIEVIEVVKSSEISDEEIDTLLNDEVGQDMTRDEAREFLENEERQDNTKFSAYQLEGEKENYKEVLVTLPTKSTKFKYKLSKRLDGGKYQIEKANGKKLPTLYQDMFEAGKAVRELNEKEGSTYDASKNFKSTHFDEINILVHLRMNTRTDSQGNKVLFLEEVQSDWGQEGKRIGFEKPEDTQAIKELENEKQKVLDSSKSYQLLNENTEGNLSVEVFDAIQQIATINIDNQYSTEESRKERFLKDIENTLSYWENYKYVVPNMNQKELSNFYDVYIKELENNSKKISGYSPSYQLASVENKLKDINKKIFEFSAKEGVKKAPFVMDTNAWTKLGLKVALKEAVRQGAKKIAWTTGEQQNDRYDLRKQVDKIEIIKREGADSYRAKTYKNGDILEDQDYIAFDQLEGMFGKEIAKKVQEGKSVFEGEGLAVGGKGMKGFYGSPTEGSLGIVGNVAKSLFKQEPSTVNIQVLKPVPANTTVADIQEAGGMDEFKKKNAINSTQNSIDITPELKAQVLEGLPQFSKGGRDVQPVVDMIKESQDEGELTDKEIAETLEEYFSKEDIQAAFDLINKPTENESPTATTEQSEFTPNIKDIKAFEKILETTSGAIRKKNIVDAVKVNPKIQEIMDNFDDLKKQLMDSVELTEDCSW